MSFLGTGFGGASGGYPITNSARFDGSTTYLARTPGSAGNGKKFTISLWTKRSALARQFICGAQTSNPTGLTFNADHTLQWQWSGNAVQFGAAVYRDPSAWMHIVIAWDTTQATAADRVKCWINGTSVAHSGATLPSLNYDEIAWNANGVVHSVGNYPAPGLYYSGYLSDVYSIDGQSLTPSDFGRSDSNGVWVPINYDGTYGTNGIKLEFQSSGNLGDDTSGNNNDWTVNGSPVQTTDTPTNNYATWNPLRPSTSTLSAGNTTAAGTASGTFSVSQSDKWYWEVKANAVGVTAGLENTSGTTYTQSVTNGTTTGFRYTNSTTTLEYTTDGSSWSTVSSSVTGSVFPYATGASNTVNFGATAFAYAPPTGFNALRTANLTSTAVTTSGTFTGNANADGPFVWTNGNPTTLTINGNAVTFGTHADKTAGGFKLRSSSASYNTSGSNTWTATAGKRFVYSATSINTAQGNP